MRTRKSVLIGDKMIKTAKDVTSSHVIFNPRKRSYPMTAEWGEVVVDNIIIGRERRLRD